MEYASVEFRKFDGGFTDEYVDCEDSQYARADNFLIDDQGKLYSRPGSEFLTSVAPSAGRIGYLYNYFKETALFCFSGGSALYYRDADYNDYPTATTPAQWVEVTGLGGNKVAAAATYRDNFSITEWRKHILVATDAGTKLALIYPTATGYTSRTAGLPALAETANYNYDATLANAITLANSIRSTMLSHFIYTTARYHLTPDAASYNVLAAVPVATNLATLLTLTKTLKKALNLHVKDIFKGSPSYHSFTGTAAFQESQLYYLYNYVVTARDPDNLSDCVELLNTLKIKHNDHDRALGNTYSLNTLLTLHDPTSSTSGGLFQVTTSSVASATTGYVITDSLTALINNAVALRDKLYNHVMNYAAGVPDATTPSHASGSSSDAWLLPATIGLTPTTRTGLIDYINMIIRVYSIHVNNGATSTTNHYGVADSTAHKLAADGSVVTLRYDTWSPELLDEDATEFAISQKLASVWAKFKTHYSYTTTVIHKVGGASITANSVNLTYDTITTGAYSYYMHYVYNYTVGNVTYEVRGPVTQKELAHVTIPSVQGIVLSNIPVLYNTIDTNYDYSNVKIKVFRTISGGTTAYLLTTLDNGTTSYTDTTSDEDLVLGANGGDPEEIYTAGGVVDFEQVPFCKFAHVIDITGYYGGFKDNPFLVMQSIQGAPESTSSLFGVSLPEENTGISSFRNVPIAFTNANVYRLEGTFDTQGRGAIRAVAISDKGGCVAPRSITQTVEGVYFWGVDGVYVTDGYSVKIVSREWLTTYANLTTTDIQKNNIFGAYDARNGEVWFGRTSAGIENDGFHVMNMNWGVLGDKAFTTISNGTAMRPTAACFFRGALIRGDSRGYVFKHRDEMVDDPKVDTAAIAASGVKQTIIWDFISRSLDYGTLAARKWSGKLTVKAKNVGNASIQARFIDDQGVRTKDLVPIRYQPNCFWGDPSAKWGATDPTAALYRWNFFASGELSEKRRPPAKAIRFTDRQVQFTNAYAVIRNSTTGGGTATVAGTSVTLTSGANWKQDLTDYYIYFSTDSYITGYKITSVSGGTLTLDSAPTAGTLLTWQIKGYPKNEKFSLISFNLQASKSGDTQSDPQGESGDLSSNSSNASV